MKLRVAAIQMEVSGDIERNAATIRRAIQQAAAVGADILLTPEGSLSGYTPNFDVAVLATELSSVTALAREQHVGLALGTCFKEPDGLTYNQLRFYAADGSYLGFHSKILRCVNLADPTKSEIDDYAASELRTFFFEDIPIGGLVCNDMWANPAWTPMPDPHLSQQLAEKGARIIFHAVNSGPDDSTWTQDVVRHFHEANLRLRAAAGMVWIVTVDNCGPALLPCAAPSGVLDPDGNWVCRTEAQGEQFFVQTIEL
ncbi:MAG TPA: carbon-nitrogen hydrolase family protein [Patescibacteria group bacterium]|jgi:predicted amidohydrolase|nr:carbon-nitrogen hydrolase family protein [Patescibacteria group bacterium]